MSQKKKNIDDEKIEMITIERREVGEVPKEPAVKKSDSLVKKSEVEITSTEITKKINSAVAFINKKVDEQAKSLLEIGEYLLKNFFDNDVKNVEDRASRKGVSLRKIANHPEITVSFMSLSNAVRLAADEHLYADSKFTMLTASHKLLLFHIEDKSTKLEYAEKVISDKLSVRKFKDLLKTKNLMPTRGRKALNSGSSNTVTSDPFNDFFTPISSLVEMEIDFDAVDEKLLTTDRIDALTVLRDRIDKLLSRVNKDEKQ